MRNMLYICIMFLGIICFIGCKDPNGNKILLAQADSLLQSRPDSALKLLNSVEKDVRFSEAEWMQFIWNRAQARHRMGMSLVEDSLLPGAINYYRERKDSSRMFDSYLLEAAYYKWMNQEERMNEAIENGLNYAEARKDTFWLLLFYRGKAEIAYLKNDHNQVIGLMEKILQYADRLSVREHYSVLYNLGLNMALVNHPSSSDYFERSVDMSLAAADTVAACHYMRNYATALANNREYVKSNDLLRRVKRLMPAVGSHVMLQITFAENFLNLHQLDSARYYWNQAWVNEQNHGGDKAEGFSVRSALVQLKTVLDYTSGTPLDIITFGRFADSVRVEMRNRNSVIEQQLETKNNLQRLNYELIIKRQKTRMYSVLVAVLLVGALVSLSFYIRNRRKRLAEAEERIDALTRLLEDAQRASDNQEENSDAFFKKLLLQQLGIIRLVANTPTSQNQALLKLISGISNKEIPVEGLLAWADLYPVIDRLYDGFYSRMMERFGQLLSEKEVQICCLLCAGFSTKEIGVVTQQTSATIYVRKTSIRKKINAGEKQDIVECIRGI